MSSIIEHSYVCEAAIRCCREQNYALCKVTVTCYGNAKCIPHLQHVNLSHQGNAFQLLPTEVNQQNFDINLRENSQVGKQGNVLWKEIQKQGHIMGSTMIKALGLSTLIKQKNNHYVYVKG